MSWNTANNAVLAEGKRVFIDDPGRFDGVTVIGVDEHVWRHTRRGDKYVTVIIDLTAVRDGTGPARLLDMVEGRSKQAFARWLADRPQQWRDGVEVVAMDGFSGFKTATTEELPDAVAVMDPFHVVRLTGNALDECRRRVQLATCGHRGRKTDPLYRAGGPCRPGPICSPTSRRPDWMPCSPSTPMSRSKPPGRSISSMIRPPTVNPTAAKARTMMADADRLAAPRRPRSPTRDHQARPHPEQPRRRRPGLLRPARHLQRAHRSDQRPPRTSPRLRPRLPQPHQLHRPITAGIRRIQTTTTPQIVKSRIRATLNPNAVRIAPACADRKTAEFMVKPPCSSYLSRPGGALARCELYAKCLRHRSPDTPEFAPKFKRKKRFQCP